MIIIKFLGRFYNQSNYDFQRFMSNHEEKSGRIVQQKTFQNHNDKGIEPLASMATKVGNFESPS